MIVTISRAQEGVTYPANFLLVGAMNPCPCGYYRDARRESGVYLLPSLVRCYQKWLSRPLLDRIDLHLEVPRIEYQKPIGRRLGVGERSAVVRERGKRTGTSNTDASVGSTAGGFTQLRNGTGRSPLVLRGRGGRPEPAEGGGGLAQPLGPAALTASSS